MDLKDLQIGHTFFFAFNDKVNTYEVLRLDFKKQIKKEYETIYYFEPIKSKYSKGTFDVILYTEDILYAIQAGRFFKNTELGKILYEC
jgi:hypothetical protein